ncbi:MAG: rod shape-determining protein MreC [Bacteroidota bacterium]|nr:rod shape-determining protein MreC [Bacteroidota bacterium]
MRLLIAFLIRNYFFFLFLILELISVNLLIRYNKYHSSVFVNAAAEYTGDFHEAFTNISQYFKHKEENRRLAAENSDLREQMISSFMLTDTLFSFQDSLYRYSEAEVISKSTRRKNNYIMLNKGEKHGISTDMGVISREGVVGIVVGISENYTIVMPLIHKHSRLSAIIAKNQQLVNVVWEEEDYQHGSLSDIPIHIELQEGDSIFTSGYSFYFPQGILIGTISQFDQNSGGNLNTARIDYAVDFNNLSHVYIVDNLNRKELESLIETSEDE